MPPLMTTTGLLRGSGEAIAEADRTVTIAVQIAIFMNPISFVSNLGSRGGPASRADPAPFFVRTFRTKLICIPDPAPPFLSGRIGYDPALC
jgi:hypothetical protein